MKITNNVRMGNPVVSLRASETSEALRRAFACSGQVLSLSKDEAIFFRLLRHFVPRNDGRRNLFVLLAMTPLAILLATLFYFTLPSASADDWPQVQKDPQHTGYSAETLGTNFKVAWTYPFQPDRIHPGTQAIIYQGKVFIGTEGANGQKPTLYALDAVNADPTSPSWAPKGKVIWKYEVEGPILHSAAADNGKIFLGAMDGAVYAVNAADGSLAWKQQLIADQGFSVAPVVAEGKVFIGGQDGKFYTLDENDGIVIWSYDTGTPILMAASYDQGKVFFGGMDMYVYALGAKDGALAWKSQKIPGMAFKDYWPVVYQNKVIIVPLVNRTSAGVVPGYPFGWNSPFSQTFATWLSQNGPTIASGSAYTIPEIVNAQDTAINNYNANPAKYTQNIYILDENTGQQSMVVPNWNTQTLSGAHTPPCVDRDGKIVVPLMFIHSGWGRLDLGLGRITDILYDGLGTNGQPVSSSNTNAAGFGNGDENLNVTCTANFVLSMHFQEGNANYTGAFNLDTRRWIPITAGMKNNQMSNVLEGRTDPASVSNGMIYHISWHELIARTTN